MLRNLNIFGVRLYLTNLVNIHSFAHNNGSYSWNRNQICNTSDFDKLPIKRKWNKTSLQASFRAPYMKAMTTFRLNDTNVMSLRHPIEIVEKQNKKEQQFAALTVQFRRRFTVASFGDFYDWCFVRYLMNLSLIYTLKFLRSISLLPTTHHLEEKYRIYEPLTTRKRMKRK